MIESVGFVLLRKLRKLSWRRRAFLNLDVKLLFDWNRHAAQRMLRRLESPDA